MPKVLLKQRAKSFKALFVYFYQASNEQSEFELDPKRVAKETGISRSQIYEAIAFLKRVKLLFTVESRTGRGKHSLYKLNWLKPAKKCPALSIKDIKTLSLRKDSTVQRRRVQNGQWGRMMKTFRGLLQRTFLTPKEIQLCCGVLGRFLRRRPLEMCRAVYQGLASRAARWQLEPPNWVLEVRQLCAWFMGVLKKSAMESF